MYGAEPKEKQRAATEIETAVACPVCHRPAGKPCVVAKTSHNADDTDEHTGHPHNKRALAAAAT